MKIIHQGTLPTQDNSDAMSAAGIYDCPRCGTTFEYESSDRPRQPINGVNRYPSGDEYAFYMQCPLCKEYTTLQSRAAKQHTLNRKQVEAERRRERNFVTKNALFAIAMILLAVYLSTLALR